MEGTESMTTLAIIADDLTGANDSGIQLAKRGFSACVMMDSTSPPPPGMEVVVYDTDSRGDDALTAYRKARAAAERFAGGAGSYEGCEGFGFAFGGAIFKKLDSTLRGNVGAELDGVCDALGPSLVVIAPSYPANGRVVRDGLLYVNGTPLHETETARDPKNPVATSVVAKIIELQSKRKPAHIARCDLASEETLFAKLRALHAQGAVYVVFDAETDRDLALIASAAARLAVPTVWAGAAGLAASLPIAPSKASRDESAARGGAAFAEAGESLAVAADAVDSVAAGAPTLTVVGSLSRRSRAQLGRLLERPDIAGIEADSDALAAEDEGRRRDEAARVVDAALAAFRRGGSVAVYSREPDAEMRSGPSREAVSTRIAEALGTIATTLARQVPLAGIALTGGDVARRFCDAAGAKRFRLLAEVEPGVPAGRFEGGVSLVGVTKAGGFGSDDALAKAVRFLQGMETQP
jgi:uncharacterized protein YgbK (DUF1537 family)